jgi:hypothetical protein
MRRHQCPQRCVAVDVSKINPISPRNAAGSLWNRLSAVVAQLLIASVRLTLFVDTDFLAPKIQRRINLLSQA